MRALNYQIYIFVKKKKMEHKKSVLVSNVLEKCEVLCNNTMQVYIIAWYFFFST